MAEGGALQAGWLWGQGLRLQLKGVTKGPRSQAVQGLDSDPEEEAAERTSDSWKDLDDRGRNNATGVAHTDIGTFHVVSRSLCDCEHTLPA